jgi:hypothetical protein
MDSGPRILQTAVYETIGIATRRSATVSWKLGEKDDQKNCQNALSIIMNMGRASLTFLNNLSIISFRLVLHLCKS